MLEYIPELAQAGISSLKIEGRMKSIFYVASVVGAYRKAVRDAYYDDPEGYSCDPAWMSEMEKASQQNSPQASTFTSLPIRIELSDQRLHQRLQFRGTGQKLRL